MFDEFKDYWKWQSYNMTYPGNNSYYYEATKPSDHSDILVKCNSPCCSPLWRSISLYSVFLFPNPWTTWSHFQGCFWLSQWRIAQVANSLSLACFNLMTPQLRTRRGKRSRSNLSAIQTRVQWSHPRDHHWRWTSWRARDMSRFCVRYIVCNHRINPIFLRLLLYIQAPRCLGF